MHGGDSSTLYETTKIFGVTKSKAFADDKISAIEKMKCVLGWVENIVEKGENGCFKHFLLFPTMFSKGFFLRIVKPHFARAFSPFPTVFPKGFFVRVVKPH